MRLAAFACVVLFAGVAEARTLRVEAGANAQAALQQALSAARPGDTVRLERGRYELSQAVTLSTRGVSVRGDGADRSVLSGAGLTVSGGDSELRDFAVENADGAGVRISGAQRVIARGLRADNNGVGFEIANSVGVDLSQSSAAGNGIGVLVGDQQLAQPGGQVRVFENVITANNRTPADEHALGGVGVLVMASHDVAVFDNEISNHGGANVLLAGYRGALAAAGGGANASFNPLPRNVVVRDNRFGPTTVQPAGELSVLGGIPGPKPDVVWDGADTYFSSTGPRTEPARIVVRDNRDAARGPGSFLSLGIGVAGAPFSEAQPSRAWPPLLDLREPEEVEIED